MDGWMDQEKQRRGSNMGYMIELLGGTHGSEHNSLLTR